jgi:hypothetical protein
MKNVIYVIVSTQYKKEIFHINKRYFYEFMLGFDFSLKYGIGNTISNRSKSINPKASCK